jgi:hypothetical protein
MPSTQPLPKPRTALSPHLVLLCWAVLAYTLLSSQVQPGQSTPLPLISAWLQPALHIPRHSLCLFKDLTHLPCVFCGLTRSFVLIGHGQWQESLHYHLLGIPFYLTTITVAVLGTIAPAKAAYLTRLLTQRRVVLLLITVLTLCWLWKLGQDPQFW